MCARSISGRSRTHEWSASQRRPRFGLAGWDLEALGAPDPLDPLGVDSPAGHVERIGDAPAPVAAEAGCQIDDRTRQSILSGGCTTWYRWAERCWPITAHWALLLREAPSNS